MRIRVVGGGPAGLYFATLAKRLDPRHEVRVDERGPRGATWGFGVVFSDRALEFLRADDEAMFQRLLPEMESWPDLTLVHRGVRVPVRGNGFAAIGRLRLLEILQDEALRAGVDLRFGSEVSRLEDVGPADLVVAADGVSSAFRAAAADRLGTTIDWRTNRFIWCGTTRPFDSLTLTFREDRDGVWCAHHYRYAPDRSTFLVEVDAATFERAGLAGLDERATLRRCEEVFAPELGGRPLLSNRSFWRTFPVVWNERWSLDGRFVLLGDALRTVHFSIGSGTRLAMEDALALARALRERADVPAALQRFEELRRPPVRKIWEAAGASLRWYERMGEHLALDPLELAYEYMVRSGRVAHEDVARMEPALAEAHRRRRRG